MTLTYDRLFKRVSEIIKDLMALVSPITVDSVDSFTLTLTKDEVRIFLPLTLTQDGR